MKIFKSKTINSAIWYTFSSVLAKGISILLTPIFARILTKADYGYYTSFVSWQNILVTVFSLELASTVLRAKFDYDEENFKHYVFSVTSFGIVFSGLCVAIGSMVVSRNSEGILGINARYIIPLALVIVFSPLIQVFQAEQRAKVKYKLSSIITVGYGVLGLLIPLIFVYSFENKLDALLYGVAFNAVLWGIGIYIVYLLKCGIIFKKEYIKYALILALPIVPHLVSSNIMGNSDKLMINSMCGPDFAALYGVIYTCSMAITLLRNALNNAWVPWFYKKMSEENYSVIKKVSDYYIIWFSLGTLIVCLFGPEIVMVMGGQQYVEAAPLVPIIMLGCYYNFLNAFYVNIELYEKKTYMISGVTVITTVMNVVLNYVCIKEFGYMAAAYTTAFCNLLIVIMHYFNTRKMRNELVCNSKLIFLSSTIGIVGCVICILSYNHISFRILLVIITIILTLALGKKTLVKFKRGLAE